MAGEVWIEVARAKINLGIKVLGLRPDGYHEICSIMQCVDLADRLSFWEADEDRLTCTDPELPSGSDNLVLQAVEVFHQYLGDKPKSFHIHLEKRIPVGAGLGGGSADAAATLRALNRLQGMPFGEDILRQMAARLGSDVPFLIAGGTALVRGRGEVFEPLQWKGSVWYVLVYPEVAIRTAWAYQQLSPSLTTDTPYVRFINSLSGGCVYRDALIEVLENDFQPVVERVYPIVADLRSYLDLAGARASSMSGSGSTVYGIFDDRNAAEQVQRALQAKGYRSFLCQPSPSP